VTTVRHEAHKVCIAARAYPRAAIFVLTAITLDAGIEGNVWVLVITLAIQLVVIIHVANRMWSPPIVISVSPPDKWKLLDSIPRQPTGADDRARRHRHAR
jgi:hypothetical protein